MLLQVTEKLLPSMSIAHACERGRGIAGMGPRLSRGLWDSERTNKHATAPFLVKRGKLAKS